MAVETTTVRVTKQTRQKLKKLAADSGLSVTEVVARLVKRHEKGFWEGFDEEAAKPPTVAERKARRTFEPVLTDGLE